MQGAVYWKAFKTSLQTKLEYRSDFFLGISAALMLQGAALGTLWVVLSKAPTENGSALLSGWNGHEVALIFGLTALIKGCAELFFNHIWYVPFYIVQGQIDRLLTYPVKSLPFFLITSPELHAFGNLAGGLFIFSYAAVKLSLPWWTWACLPYWIVCGSLVNAAVLVFCGALCFRFMGRKGQHFWVAESLLQASRYPLGVYPRFFGVLLLILVPYSAINYLPIGWTLGRFPLAAALLAPALAAAVSSWAAFRIWDWGLNKYESTGS